MCLQPEAYEAEWWNATMGLRSRLPVVRADASVLGRLLDPRDFGLVGMVKATIGVLNLFRDFGLSPAAVQRADITAEQHSTLFWVNIHTSPRACAVRGIAPGHCDGAEPAVRRRLGSGGASFYARFGL